MMSDFSAEHPLRVAIIGAGPAGFYAAGHLFKELGESVTVDMFEQLPTPYGLVRSGVAPDHQKIKGVVRIFEKIAKHPGFRFFGNVTFGKHIELQDLHRHYHQVLFATGMITDRTLGIPGESFAGSYPATSFVAWYNGHPHYRDLQFDLSHQRAVIVGVGNVALDVARILSRSPEELETSSDIADYALEALRKSQIKEVILLGRRGPAQAAFTNPELLELGHLPNAQLCISPEDAQPDPLTQQYLKKHPDKGISRKLELLQEFAQTPRTNKARQIWLRFLVSPVEILGDEHGHVSGLKLVHNELYCTEAGTLRPRPTERFEEISAGLVFRSIGYRGSPLKDVPFHDAWGIIPNQHGRVLNHHQGEVQEGMYVAGWIKRGPLGVIGTNKPDAIETVNHMIEDAAAGKTWLPENPTPEAILQLLEERQPEVFHFDDWLKLDQMELARGKECGRPRVKFTDIKEMREALNQYK